MRVVCCLLLLLASQSALAEGFISRLLNHPVPGGPVGRLYTTTRGAATASGGITRARPSRNLIAVHKEAANFKLENQKAAATPIPYHPGAIKYLAERGIKIN